MDTVMKRAIFAVIFCLAAASTAAAADDTLAGLIQAGNRDAALKRIAAGADVNAAQGDGTTPLHWAVYKIDADLARALLERGAKPDVINNYGSSPLAEAVKVANARLVAAALPYLTLTLDLTRPEIGNKGQLDKVFETLARMTDALRPLVDSYFHTQAVATNTPGGAVDAHSRDLRPMSGGEGFYLDPDGNKQDADIHEAILAVGDSVAYKAASRRRALEIGLPCSGTLRIGCGAEAE
jgi:ankyrin repeat protein